MEILSKWQNIISGTDEGFAVYSGDDGLTFPLLAIGGNGVVSVASHVVGNEMQKMIASFKEGRYERGGSDAPGVVPLFRALFAAPNPVPVKYALQKIGVDVGGVRLPLVGYDDQNIDFDKVWKTLKKIDHIFD